MPRVPMRRLDVPGALACAAACFIVACASPEEPTPPPTTTTVPPAARAAPAAPATFVGAAACAPCHPQETAAWRGSHHDRAMQIADDTTVLGDFGGRTLTHFGVTSTFFKKDGAFFVRTEGPDGKLADYQVAYTFGVDPLQQYLVSLPGGRWQALPLAWDTRPRAAGGQRWFHLNPDERIPPGDLLHWTGIAGTWNHMCAECHSTNVRKNYDPAAERYETTWSEIDVACEACHGPGSNHVAWARAETDGAGAEPHKGLVDLGDADGAHWVMDPAPGIARRSAPRRSHVEVETCGRCHSRRGLVSEDYVWGRPLLDTHRVALLDEVLYHADGQIKDEVYEYGSFLQSRMYAAGVTCTDCHDAHSTRLRDATDDVNAVCARCHLPARFATPEHHHHAAGSPGASCVACHMPERTYMVVDPRRDHSLRVPRPDLSVKIGTPNPCTGCHAKEPAQWAADAATRWWGTARGSRPHWGEAIHAGREDLPGAGPALAGLTDDTTQPGIVRATAVSMLGRYLGPATGPTVERALRDQDPLVRDAALAALTGVDPQVRARLVAPLLRDPVRTVRIDAARALAVLPPDQLADTDRAPFESALAEDRAAQMVNADRPEGQLNLAMLEAERGDFDTAERRYRDALRIAPAFASTYVNLADLYRAQGRDAEGEQVLRQGLAVAPQDADLHHALGLALIRQKRLAEALGSLARATELAPEQARYAYVYAVALHDTGQPDHALGVLRAAHERHPGDRDVLIALATMSRDRGNRAAALAWARALRDLDPQDAGAQRLVAELQR
jgi:predicted CXXCH cytochrome family protein